MKCAMYIRNKLNHNTVIVNMIGLTSFIITANHVDIKGHFLTAIVFIQCICHRQFLQIR